MEIGFLKKGHDFIYRFILLFLVLIVIFSAGCTNNSTNNQSSPQSNYATPTYIPISTPTYIPTSIVTPTPETQRDRNIETIKNIVEEYHQTHTYNLPDMYACTQMSQDVWDMVETQGITAIIKVGNVNQNVNTIHEADHAWVLAEVSPNEWIAMETTAGYLVCSDPSICAINNPRYYTGWNFNTPKDLQDYMNNPSGCSAGYVLGNDNLCHPACGANNYCSGNSACVNQQCVSCNAGYILGQDYQCHQACGANNYCTGNSVCVNGQCRGCNPGYIVGQDLLCHPICGNGYCATGACVNGRCIRL